MKMNEKKTTTSIPSGFYNSSLSKQGRDGEHERFSMDFYTGNVKKEVLKAVAQDFPGEFYKTENQ